MERSRPVEPTERIVAIDIVRGLALYGVMAINVVTEFRAPFFQRFLTDQVGGTAVDRLLYSILMVIFDQKALALFSILFGVGLAIQLDSLAKTPRRTWLMIRRLLVLMVIGALQLTLIWNGDILMSYAIAGLIALPLIVGTTSRPAFIGAGILWAYTQLPPMVAMPSRAWMQATSSEALRVYGSGSFTDALTFRLHEMHGFLPLHIAALPRTLGLMLIGAALWRAQLFRTDRVSNTLLAWVAGSAVSIGVLMGILQETGWFRGAWKTLLLSPRETSILLAFGYGAAILLATRHAPLLKSLALVAPLGRMAITNYLAQSFVFSGIFYGYGLGMFGKLGVGAALAIGTAVYAVQIVFSRWWLQRFRFGPVEWLWRSATYGAWQPMRVRNA